jgi:hypothetical protein
MYIRSVFGPTARFIAFLVLAVLTPLRAQESAGPGWRCLDFRPLPPLGSVGEAIQIPQTQNQHPAKAAVASLSTQPYAGSSPTYSTPEIQALATGLDNDPVRIFNYVRNKIAFQPHYGCNKGARVTNLDSAGNDMARPACLLPSCWQQPSAG